MHGLRNGLDLRWLGLVAEVHAQPQRLELVLQRQPLFRRRTLVHTVQAGVLGGGDELRCAHIGRQHGLFDEAVSFVARARHDLLDTAVVVAHDLRLGGLEVDRATPGALLEQGPIDLVQVQQVGHQVRTALRLGPARVGQDGRHLGVGQPRMGADERRIELEGLHLAVGVHHHVAGQCQAFDFRVQRAQAVGQFLRQHGNDPPREVDRGGTLVGVLVQRLTGLDVMADVGDGDDETPAAHRRLPPALLVGLAVDGIVEVARVFAVDGDQRHVAQVDAMLAVGGAQLFRQGRGMGQRLGRELVRHLVLAHGDLDLHARIVDLAQHLGHTADRLRVQRRRFGEFDRDHLPHCGTGRGVLGDQDVLAVAAVLGGDDPLPTFVQQATDDGRLAPLQDVDDTAFGTALAVVPQDTHAHPVLVQHAAHFLRREVDPGLAGVRQDITVAVAMALHDAVDFTHQGGADRRWACDVFFFDDMILSS